MNRSPTVRVEKTELLYISSLFLVSWLLFIEPVRLWPETASCKLVFDRFGAAATTAGGFDGNGGGGLGIAWWFSKLVLQRRGCFSNRNVLFVVGLGLFIGLFKLKRVVLPFGKFFGFDRRTLRTSSSSALISLDYLVFYFTILFNASLLLLNRFSRVAQVIDWIMKWRYKIITWHLSRCRRTWKRPFVEILC